MTYVDIWLSEVIKVTEEYITQDGYIQLEKMVRYFQK